MKIKPDNISTPQGRHVHRSYFKHTTFFFKLHTLLTTVCRPRNTHPIQEHQKRYKWHYKGWSSEHQKILSLHGKSFLLGAWFLKIKLIPEYSWMQLDLFWILTSCRESAIFLVSQRPTGHMLNKALPWHPGSWATRGPAAPSCPQLVVEQPAGLLPPPVRNSLLSNPRACCPLLSATRCWGSRGPAAPFCPQLVVEEPAGLLPLLSATRCWGSRGPAAPSCPWIPFPAMATRRRTASWQKARRGRDRKKNAAFERPWAKMAKIVKQR